MVTFLLVSQFVFWLMILAVAIIVGILVYRSGILDYVTYLVVGVGGTWVLLFLWGLTAGPQTSAPYYWLLASLALWLGASVLSLYFPKAAAAFTLGLAALAIATGVVFETW